VHHLAVVDHGKAKSTCIISSTMYAWSRSCDTFSYIFWVHVLSLEKVELAISNLVYVIAVASTSLQCLVHDGACSQ